MYKPAHSRRQWLKSISAMGLAASGSTLLPYSILADNTRGAVDIGSRRELFVDDYLIETMRNASRVLHHPVPQDVALRRDSPWEGNTCSYTSVFRDGELYRMYYRGSHMKFTEGKARRAHREVACYAESRDGVHWTKPELGLIEFNGSKENNIVWDGIGSHCFMPFKDTNPDCPPEMAYKAVGRSAGKRELYAFRSADAIHWSLLSDEPIITKGEFDSQNVAFWDSCRGEYRAYVRDFRDGRDIRTCTSANFVNWSEPVFLEYSPGRMSQLYTNAIIPYYRAPHIFLGFPGRYVDHGWAESTRKLPEPKHRKLVASSSRRSGTAFHDTMFMSSRDGRHFEIWPESFVRPGIQRPGAWFYGDSRQNWGLVETQSPLPGAPNDLSIYVNQGRQLPTSTWLLRYTLRIDGFVSVQAPLAGGEAITRPLVFQGVGLEINFSTSAAGSMRVELQDADGRPIPGFTLEESRPQYGDQIDRVVAWKSGADLSQLAGQPVRLRFELKDADLYAFRFATRG